MDDPYRVLGVDRKADDAEIKKAYRKLAKELHPDLHPNDSKISERFKDVSAAYELLSNKDKRARYDRGEIDAKGNQRVDPRMYRRYYSRAGGAEEAGGGSPFEGFRGFGFNPEDLFGDLFGSVLGGRSGARMRGQDAPQRGADRHYRLSVGFVDAARGCKRRIRPKSGKTLEVGIPAGIEDGKVIRLKGQGEPGAISGPVGDLLVEVKIKLHALFRRDGNDIQMDLPISFPEAVLGTRVEVPTIEGPVTLKVPKGSKGNQVMRLKGRGIKPKGAAKAGDQLVRLIIVMPDKPDESLIRFATDWAKEHAYNPRCKGGSET